MEEGWGVAAAGAQQPVGWAGWDKAQQRAAVVRVVAGTSAEGWKWAAG